MNSSTFSNPNNILSPSGSDASGFGINSFTPQAQVRAPRGNILINGINCPWVTWAVQSTGRTDSDTFRVTIPVHDLPTELSLEYFTTQKEIICEIEASPMSPTTVPNTSTMDTIIYGIVDHMSYEPDKANINISGRDYSKKLMDKKSSIKYQNQTASQIVSKVAANSGLTPVITDTGMLSGKYYQIDHARLTDQTTDWDLVQYLAREQHYVTYVKGKNLYFQPQETNATPYVIDLSTPGYTSNEAVVPQSNAVQIELMRNFQLAKGAKVTIKSWNLKQKKSYTNSAKAGIGGDAPLSYDYSHPNLSPSQAKLRAKSKLKDIMQHEFSIHITMPADNLLTPQIPVEVIGTNSAFDQIYYLKTVSREMAFNQGYTMTFEAMNMSKKKTVTEE